MPAIYMCARCRGTVTKTTKVCPHCGAHLAGIKCQNCGFVGSEKDFTNDRCPNCHSIVKIEKSIGANITGEPSPSIPYKVPSSQTATVQQTPVQQPKPNRAKIPTPSSVRRESGSQTQQAKLSQPAPKSSILSKLGKFGKNTYGVLSKASTILKHVIEAVGEVGQLAEEKFFQILSWRPSESKTTTSTIKNITTELKQLIVYLVKSTQILDSLLEKAINDPANQTKYYRQAADLICWMLQKVLKNNHFRTIVVELERARSQHAIELAKIITDPSLSKEFVLREYKLLNSYCVPRFDTLMTEINDLLIDMRAEGGRVPHTNVYEAINNLHVAMYRLYDDLREHPPTEEKQKVARQTIVKAIVGVEGIIIALINVYAQQQGVLTPPQATLSGYIGSGIISVIASYVLASIDDVIK